MSLSLIGVSREILDSASEDSEMEFDSQLVERKRLLLACDYSLYHDGMLESKCLSLPMM